MGRIRSLCWRVWFAVRRHLPSRRPSPRSIAIVSLGGLAGGLCGVAIALATVWPREALAATALALVGGILVGFLAAAEVRVHFSRPRRTSRRLADVAIEREAASGIAQLEQWLAKQGHHH